MGQSNDDLRRPLYIFDLPKDLLNSLQLRLDQAGDSNSTGVALHSQPVPSNSAPSFESSRIIPQEEGPSSAKSCSLCGLSFTSLQDQRNHVRSDLHNYNLKQKIRGLKPVGETEFEKLIANLDDSLSGSDTSSDDPDDDGGGDRASKDSALSVLLKRQAHITDGGAESAPMSSPKRGPGNSPLYWFTSAQLPTNTLLGFYRVVFSTDEQNRENELVTSLQQKQLTTESTPMQAKRCTDIEEDEGGVPLPASMIDKLPQTSGPYYFLCMIGGGHFAAMLVSLTPKLTKKNGVEDRSAIVIAHKTFHRYTTRRKQGGSQSANDNAKGNAHSAGSSIRRHNEVALIEEVRALLASWRALIDSAELLFVRASGSTNRRTLFGPYEDQVLNIKDPRLRGFPFSTRRATQSELMRAFVELTRVKINVVDEAALLRQSEEAAAKAAQKDGTTNKKPSGPKLDRQSKEDEISALHTTQMQALIRRSKAPGLLSYLQTNQLSPDFRFFPLNDNHQAPTPLHFAAANSSPACIIALLVKAGADPGDRNADGKSPFDIAGDRASRDAFRLARSHLGESRWDWDQAHVPSALSQADVDARVERERSEKMAEEAAEKQRREAETQRLRREDAERLASARESKFGRGHVLEKPKMTAEERRMHEAKGMSDELRLRMEREKRARAAEERMKRLQGR